MEAKELRIGNYVKDRSGKTLRIDWWENINKVCMDINIGGTQVHPLTEYPELCNPIQITREWLLNLGFKEHKLLGSFNIGQFRFHSQRPFQNAKKFNLVTELYYCERAILVSGGVKEVHQLQNLYFALTNKELEIK